MIKTFIEILQELPSSDRQSGLIYSIGLSTFCTSALAFLVQAAFPPGSSLQEEYSGVLLLAGVNVGILRVVLLQILRRRLDAARTRHIFALGLSIILSICVAIFIIHPGISGIHWLAIAVFSAVMFSVSGVWVEYFLCRWRLKTANMTGPLSIFLDRKSDPGIEDRKLRAVIFGAFFLFLIYNALRTVWPTFSTGVSSYFELTIAFLTLISIVTASVESSLW